MKMSDAIVWTAWMVQHAEAAEMSVRPKGFTSNRLDCRSGFVNAMSTAMLWANEGFIADNFHISAPYVDISKADIAKLGAARKVPFEDTWSCYKGALTHCGCCGTCVERAESFHLAGVPDPTQYADPNFWKQAVADYRGAK